MPDCHTALLGTHARGTIGRQNLAGKLTVQQHLQAEYQSKQHTDQSTEELLYSESTHAII